MPVHVQKEGQYERFETTKGNEILVLNGEMWYSIVEGQSGEIAVLTDADHQKRRTLQDGRFYLTDFEEDPTFRDVPHLFLEADSHYEEAILPNGLPTSGDKQKKIIRTDDTISTEELEEYLQNPAPAGSGDERMGRPRGGSLSNVTHYLKGIDLPADRRQLIDVAEERDAPAAVVSQLEEMPDGRYRTMADVTAAIGEGKEPLPIEHYDDLSASEITARLDNQSADELRRLKAHEERTLGRKTILRKIEEQLEPGGENLPIEGYENMRADELTDHLDHLGAEELEAVKEHERRHRNRKTVLEAVDRQLD